MAGKKVVISDPKETAEAVASLAKTRHVTEEAPHVDDSAQVGRW